MPPEGECALGHRGPVRAWGAVRGTGADVNSARRAWHRPRAGVVTSSTEWSGVVRVVKGRDVGLLERAGRGAGTGPVARGGGGPGGPDPGAAPGGEPRRPPRRGGREPRGRAARGGAGAPRRAPPPGRGVDRVLRRDGCAVVGLRGLGLRRRPPRPRTPARGDGAVGRVGALAPAPGRVRVGPRGGAAQPRGARARRVPVRGGPGGGRGRADAAGRARGPARPGVGPTGTH